ncbi:MAG: hypothetical protein RR710_04610 [Oscillospiraceae bacterium]
MPTYYENILIVSGKPEDIKEFAKKCKGYDMYYPNSSDDYTREIDEFIRKTEAAKRKEYGKSPETGGYSRETIVRIKAEAAAEATKKFRPRTEEEIESAIEKHRHEHFSQPPYFGLNNLHPEPEDNAASENWGKWRMENWGCKHATTNEYEEYDDHIRVVLNAANGFILPWAQKVSLDFPHLTFELEWNGGLEKGTFLVKNGKILAFHNSILD